MAPGPVNPNIHARARVPELGETAGANDEASLRRAVEHLDSDDPLIRMTAITALQRRTGHHLEYDHRDPLPKRRAAVARWVEHADPGGDGDASDGSR